LSKKKKKTESVAASSSHQVAGEHPDKKQTDKKQAVAKDEALRQAEARIAELEDKLLRAHAEMDNVRKRAARQVEEVSKFAVERFASALLDVTDNLERALQVESADVEALREGVKLTLNSLHDVKRKFGIERVDAVGKPFDPNLHEAILQVPSEQAAGTVIEQHVAGYTLHGRLLRPARVIVSSGPAEETKKKAS